MTHRLGKLLVISGPSGVGKSTIARALEDRLDAKLSISMTTRPKSNTDREGVDYHFVDHDRFEQAIENDELLEWERVFDHYYGTPRNMVLESLNRGEDVILEIDVNGGVAVFEKMPDAIMIFILPPTHDELLNRLRSRKRESEERIQRRFAEAKREIAQAKTSGAYKHFLINDDLESTISDAAKLALR